MKNYQVNREVDGKIGSITSSDGTQLEPVRNVAGEIQGFKVHEPGKIDPSSVPDSDMVEMGCSIIANSTLGKLVRKILNIYFRILMILLIFAGSLLALTLILYVIQYVTGIEIFEYIAKFLT